MSKGSLKVEDYERPHVSLQQNIYWADARGRQKCKPELFIQLQSLLFPQEEKMAASPLNLKAPCHARSISLPSAPHPLVSEFNEHLKRLGATEAASSSISQRLSSLKDLHDCVDNLLVLPLTQQTFHQNSEEKWVDELLDGSLRLLDVCGAAKDALLQTWQPAHELQSSMRRRRGGESGISSEVMGYLTARKKVKKAIHKALKDLKGVEKRFSFSPLNKDPETISMVSMLREAETVTLKVLESVLSSIAGETASSKTTGWSLVSHLVWQKNIACEKATVMDLGEFEKVDAVLFTLSGHKIKSNPVHIDNVQTELEKLETRIQDLEAGIEFLYRRLIKTRVSLLNILSH